MCGVTNSNGPIMHILTIFYPFDNNSTLSKHLQNTHCDNILLLSDKTHLSRAEKNQGWHLLQESAFFALATNQNNHGQKLIIFADRVYFTQSSRIYLRRKL